MYSSEIREKLEEEGIEIGDRVKAGGREGRLMPKPESGDPEVLVVKLDSGYNIGVEADDPELVESIDTEDREKPEITRSEELPDILVLHTGGTIASRVSYEEGGVKPAFDPEDLLEMYPELADEVNLHSEVVAQMLSEDMEPGHWLKIAEKIDEEKDGYDGIIVGHGTDTMAYTGAALSFMLQGIDTGVLLVGAQRSSDRPSSDAAMNMYSAARFLTETDFQGFGVCMHASSNDTECSILPAHKVRKMHTSRRDAFQAVNTSPLGRVNYETGEVETGFENTGEEYRTAMELDENVGYLKVRPGMEPEELEFLIEQDYNGVVIEGTGLGHMPVNAFDDETEHHEQILEKLETLAEDTLVVMASQTLFGRVDMNVYDAGLKIQQAGVIGAEDMHPELAYVKLMWALGNAEDREEAEKLLLEDVAGELESRSMYHG
ncbi:MAG: Glu-tRNA(Gln) amidotransferase subunit GatD [Candidatus Nanohaloarchaea archaeon]